MSNQAQLRDQFELCIDQHAESMYRVAYRLMGKHDLANELVQETYFQAWRSIGSLQDISKLRSWMFSILRNQRTKLLRRTIKSKPMEPQILETLVESSDESPQHTENVRAVQDGLNQLSEEHKLPILLVSMEGLSVDEASEILELPRGTVLSRLHRGRQKLKDILQRDGYQP